MLFLGLFLVLCTENQRVKQFGGTGIITLPKGEKLVNVTWKDNNLWYLSRPMIESETADVYTFKEESSFGVLEGTYKIIEIK